MSAGTQLETLALLCRAVRELELCLETQRLAHLNEGRMLREHAEALILAGLADEKKGVRDAALAF